MSTGRNHAKEKRVIKARMKGIPTIGNLADTIKKREPTDEEEAELAARIKETTAECRRRHIEAVKQGKPTY